MTREEAAGILVVAGVLLLIVGVSVGWLLRTVAEYFRNRLDPD